jgi:glycosyltransferase involved in cell wall biosynthesis
MNGPAAPASAQPIALSICIATYRRAGFLAQTLDSILAQLGPGTELIVVDGASPDDTPAVVRPYLQRSARITYHREPRNSGFDADYDRAVGYARGEFCWLMTDDDVLAPGAVPRVLAALEAGTDLVLVNAEVCDRDFASVLQPRLLPIDADARWSPGRDAAQDQDFFARACIFLSFVGGVIIRRSLWQARAREPYFGSMFVHVGVIFQAPIPGAVVAIAQPQVRIRYGNALWTPRSFEIWMVRWPRLIWSFDRFPETVRQRITRREPTLSARRLLWFRAIGAYGPDEYDRIRSRNARGLAWARIALRIPARLANVALALYCLFSAGASARLKLFDLIQARTASFPTRAIGRLRGVRNV